ncbi:MAG: heat-inducible transcriptional repressor HrcA [Anaeroplasmataceae bacterium]
MLTDRQKLILKAIIEEYIATNEPVGSKGLTDKPYLNYSSATLRYDMQYLEESGYLEKTHTSSGRIPSQIGYKYYVEHLITRDDDLLSELKEFDEILMDRELSLEDALKKVVDLLSDKTGYMAVVNGSAANYALVKKLEIVPLGKNEALMLVVTSNGVVESQVIQIPEYVNTDDLLKLIDMFDNAMYDHPVYEIRNVLSKEASKPRIRKMVDFRDDILNFIIKCFSRFQNSDYYTSGLSKIFNQPEFHEHQKMQKFIDVVDQGVLSSLLNEFSLGLTIRMGIDNANHALKDCAIISIPYIINDDAYGTLAVIGPVRMNYKRVIPTLEYVAKSMSKLYDR